MHKNTRAESRANLNTVCLHSVALVLFVTFLCVVNVVDLKIIKVHMTPCVTGALLLQCRFIYRLCDDSKLKGCIAYTYTGRHDALWVCLANNTRVRSDEAASVCWCLHIAVATSLADSLEPNRIYGPNTITKKGAAALITASFTQFSLPLCSIS